MPTEGLRNEKSGRPSGRESFEIAIICALPLESSAVSYLFDEFFDDPDDGSDPYEKIDGDPNHYTTGRIGKLNVVIVLLPGMGKASAASAAAYLKASYNNVRLALVVGVCGGVPGPNKNGDELLLGDVVISNALVQYDLGRQYPGGVFLRKSSLQENLGRPNKSLRALLKSFETDRNRDKLEKRTAHYLKELQTTYSKRSRKKRGKYSYPGADEDELFEPTYCHRHRFATCCNEETTCSRSLESSCDEAGCEDNYLVDREILKDKRKLEDEDPSRAQEPAIYIGAVASGDTVMKSGEDRDRIAKDESILAFEMEGAGVWDEVPCIVIKGVCDYSDSHKRKRWQDFAAATAASATKALLEALGTIDRQRSLVSQNSSSSLSELVRQQGHIANGNSCLLTDFMQFAIQHQLPPQIQFQKALVVDARGGYIPFYIETVNSKEVFVEILRSRFKDLGVTKIDRGEWSLENMNTGEVLDLSQPWQTMIKRNRLLKMNMDFRRRNVPTTKCPSCSFENEGLSTDRIECNICRVTYRRIEEIHEIEINQDAPGKTSEDATSIQEPPRPRTPKRPRPEEDIGRYKHIRVIDTSFKIRKADSGDVSTNRGAFSIRHLHDEELFAEELAKRWGLPEDDCMRVLAESESQLSALRSLVGYQDVAQILLEKAIQTLPMVRKKSGELVRPSLRHQTQRRPVSMPSKPTFSKAVHFDSNLEHVRHFLQVDRPNTNSPTTSSLVNANPTLSEESEAPFAGLSLRRSSVETFFTSSTPDMSMPDMSMQNSDVNFEYDWADWDNYVNSIPPQTGDQNHNGS